MNRVLPLLAFLIACGGSKAAPPPVSGGATAKPAAAASCTHDDECTCRRFDGAKFQEGTEPSKCCTQQGGCADALGATVSTGHCMTCVYD